MKSTHRIRINVNTCRVFVNERVYTSNAKITGKFVQKPFNHTSIVSETEMFKM